MRKLSKGDEAIECWKKMMKSPSKPKTWDDLHKRYQTVYIQSRKHIGEIEQNCLCGYTELPFNNIFDTHIDHYVKRDIDFKLAFKWSNLIVAIHHGRFGADFKDAKIQKDDYVKILNPVIDMCHDYYDYTMTGEMIPRSDLSNELKEKCTYTRDIFNLNHDSLKNRRKEIACLIHQYKEGGLDSNDIRTVLDKFGLTSAVEYYLQNI